VRTLRIRGAGGAVNPDPAVLTALTGKTEGGSVVRLRKDQIMAGLRRNVNCL